MFNSDLLRALCCAIFFAVSSLAFAAEQKLDPDKLKPGDKLEFRTAPDEWQPVEFVGKGPTANTLLINRPPFARPVSTPLSLLRLPQAAPQAPPLATNVETSKPVEDLTAKPRTWSDRTGGFKLEAVLVRVENGNAVLKRTDNNTEISVPLEKLSDADRKLLASTQPAAAAPEGLSMKAPRTADAATAAKSADGSATKAPNADSIALVPTDFRTAKKIELPESAPWTYAPDLAPKIALSRAYSIRLRPGTSIFDGPERVLPLPKDKKAFVVFLDHSPGNDKYIARVQACGLDSGKVEGAAVFGIGFEPLEVSADGSLVLGRSSGFFDETHNELRIYQRTGQTVKPLCAWQPYATSTEADDRKSEASANQKLGVRWAALVDNQHVVTLNEDAELVLWEIPSLKPIYRLKLDLLSDPVLSANNKYLFATQGNDLIVLSIHDGQPAGRLKYSDDDGSGSLFNATLALSPDGKRLATLCFGQVRIWDLKLQKVVRDFIINGMIVTPHDRLDWISDSHLLSNGQVVIDVERRIPISRAVLPLQAYDVQAGKTWYLEAAIGFDPPTLKVATMPDEAMLAAAAKINPDDLLVLRPGISIAIDFQASGTSEEIEQAKKSLVERLMANGMSVAPESTTRLVATIGSGKTETMHYSNMAGKAEEMQVPTLKLSLSFKVNDETLWNYEQQSHAPGGLVVKEGETLGQVVAREMEFRNKAIAIQGFASIRLPMYVARFPKPEGAK